MLGRALARPLLVRVPILVLALLPLWYLCRAPLAEALALPAGRVLEAYVREGLGDLRRDGPNLWYVWARPDGPPQPWRAAPSDAIHVNVVVFAALVLATPELRVAQRLTVLGAGLPLLYAADVLALFMAVRWLLVSDFGYLGPGATASSRITLTYYWPQLFLASVGNQAAPVAAWLAGLAFALRRRRPRVAPETLGRNAPCPCGSGLKYKRCCGAR
jgi:hypothetical protein